MAYVEKDVSRDRPAAEEMVRRSGQLGVPVIALDDTIVVGFDQPRLEGLLQAATSRSPRLGASVAPTAGGGLIVGQVHPGSLAASAGLRRGDVIREVDAQAVSTPEQLQQRLAQSGNAMPRLTVKREENMIELVLPGH